MNDNIGNRNNSPISAFCVKYSIDELVLQLSAPIVLLHIVTKKCYKDDSRQKLLRSSKNVDKQEINSFKHFCEINITFIDLHQSDSIFSFKSTSAEVLFILSIAFPYVYKV